jgi:hypothetical protein
MAKSTEHSNRHVVWHLHGDAIRPKEAPWGFVVQNPVQRTLMPGQVARIDTGVAASLPMIACVRGDQGDYVTVPSIVPAGQTLVVTVENKSKHMPLTIDDSEALANVHPLAWAGTSEVD